MFLLWFCCLEMTSFWAFCASFWSRDHSYPAQYNREGKADKIYPAQCKPGVSFWMQTTNEHRLRKSNLLIKWLSCRIVMKTNKLIFRCLKVTVAWIFCFKTFGKHSSSWRCRIPFHGTLQAAHKDDRSEMNRDEWMSNGWTVITNRIPLDLLVYLLCTGVSNSGGTLTESSQKNPANKNIGK